MPNDLDDALSQLQLTTFDDALGRRIIDTHIWAVREGLRGADAYRLFDGFSQRLVIDGTPPLAGARGDGDAASAMERLRLYLASRPQRHRDQAIRACRPGGADLGQEPLLRPNQRAAAGEDSPAMRRRIEAGPDERDFPVLEESSRSAPPTTWRSSSLMATRATARRERESSIPSRPIGEAASATTTLR